MPTVRRFTVIVPRVLVALVALTAAGLFLRHQTSGHLDLTRGALVNVGGFRLWLRCTGSNGPTVVMDSGYGSDHTAWKAVRPLTSQFARSCVYDRAGSGHSDPGSRPYTSARIVSELHTLLGNAGIRPPYLLIGHSFGGMNMRLFAYRYPHQVSGLVEVDSSYENECAHEPGDFCNDPAIQSSMAQLRAASRGNITGSLGSLPLIVLSQDSNDKWWSQYQALIASASSDSVHAIAMYSGHSIEKERPALVAAAAREMEQLLRTHASHLPPCLSSLAAYGGRCVASSG